MADTFSHMISTLTKQFSVLRDVALNDLAAIFSGILPFFAFLLACVLLLLFLECCMKVCFRNPYRGLSKDELKKLLKIKGHQLLLQSDCCICLESIELEDEVQQLPGCNHGFHSHCIGTWLSAKSFCPLCRSNVRLELEDNCLC